MRLALSTLLGPPETRGGSAVGLLVWVFGLLALAALGNAVTQPAIADGWYGRLAKPAFNPPPTVFGIVWTVLFIAQGVAAWLVWRAPRSAARGVALLSFAAQWGLNFGWSALFFGFKNPDLALKELFLFLGVVAAAAFFCARVDRRAGLLFLPYLAWCFFAALLNGWIVAAN